MTELVRRAYPDAGDLRPEPMQGGASTRRFFRIQLGKAAGTAVVMYVPGAATHEIHKDAQHVRWPFLEIRDLLAERGIRVPKILLEGATEGYLVVEDLGDDTIANYLLQKPQAKRAVYQAAVHDLARAQKRLAQLPDACIVKSRAFDHDLLRRELDHFLEWGIVARGIPLTSTDRASFEEIADRLATRIADWPRGFVHRDYQSRNLMVVPSKTGNIELSWIDFQDALLGPRVYDLVALLSDSYQEFDAAFIDERLAEYAEHMGLASADLPQIRREFDFVTVQRKLKDAGRFIFIDRTHNNPAFLSFVEPTIRKARAAIERLGDDADMRTLGTLLARVLAR